MENKTIFQYCCETNVFFGPGSLESIIRILKEQQPGHLFIVCDEGVAKAGILEQILQPIESEDYRYTVFSDVEPNPSSETVHKGKQLYEESGADFIVAVGGGSPLDVAKGISILAANGGDLIDYEGMNRIPLPGAPLIAIPTTAGTASEVTSFAVITDPKRAYKASIGGKNVAPKWAIVDPVLTLSLPPSLTAATGLDALVHAIESFTSRLSNPISDVLALEAIRKISSNLREAVHFGNNIQARTEMLLGSMLAGMAFTHTRLGNVHAMSHPLSAHYHVPHGVANSVLLPYVMEFNRMAVPHKYKQIAIAMGEKHLEQASDAVASIAAIEAVRTLSKDIGIPDSFRSYGVSEEMIPVLVEDALRSGNLHVNPRSTSASDVEAIYRLTF